MKISWIAALLTVCASINAAPAPMPKAWISADAKWVLHLDIDAFRQTQLGQAFGEQIADKHLAKPKDDLKTWFNVDLDWRKIHSITAYGCDFQQKPNGHGVLVVSAEKSMIDQLNGAMKNHLSANKPENIEQTQSDPYPIYSFNKDLMAAPVRPGILLISKSRQDLENAEAVIAGKSKNLKDKAAFTGYPDVASGFFFLGVAEGFSGLAELAEANGADKNQPQAKVLQMADGLRAVLGENGKMVFLNLALKAKNSDVCQQMHQVIQGLVALVSLSQKDNADLMQLAQSIKVTSSGNQVSLQVEYPTERMMEKVVASTEKKEKAKSEGKKDGDEAVK